MKRTLSVLLWLAFALPATAAGNFTNCSDPSTLSSGVLTETNPNVGQGGQICYLFDAATDSAQFVVKSGTALISFDPDATGTTGAARVNILRCPYATPAGSMANQCYAILANVLDGVGGAAATQTASVRVPSGAYRIDVTVAPSGAEKPVVTIEGGS